MFRADIVDFSKAICIFAALIGCLEFWFFIGRKVRRHRGETLDQLVNIQAATLGLLALLLGFSFALAAGRFSDHIQLIVQESNAIGTTWLRCDLLSDADRDALRQLIRQYTDERVNFYNADTEDAQDASLKTSSDLQAKMWLIISAAAKSKPELANVLLPPFNDMFDFQSTRAEATKRHMPTMIFVLLLTCSLASIASVGYGCGIAGKRNVVLSTALTFLIAGTLWAIIDMDYPRKGLIRVNQQPLLELQQSLKSN